VLRVRPVFVDEAQSDARGQDHRDDDRIGVVAQDKRDRRGDHQQDEQGAAQVTAEHRPGPDLIRTALGPTAAAREAA
jgi:hypothetical protein